LTQIVEKKGAQLKRKILGQEKEIERQIAVKRKKEPNATEETPGIKGRGTGGVADPSGKEGSGKKPRRDGWKERP